MEKTQKHLTIIGTCISRNLFEDIRLKNIFKIDTIAFHVLPWAMFEPSLNIPDEYIDKSSNPFFYKSNLKYDLNKTLINTLSNFENEYLLIDLYSLDIFYKVTYENISTYVKTNDFETTIKPIINVLNQNGKKLTYEQLLYNDFDESIIRNGFKKLAEFINKTYKHSVILIPKNCKKYFDKDYNVKDYDFSKIQKSVYLESFVEKWSIYLSSLLNKAKIVYYKDNFISEFRSHDFTLNFSLPSAIHLSRFDQQCLANDIINAYEIDYKGYYSQPISIEQYNMQKLCLDYEKFYSYFDKSFNQILCNINAYTNFLNTLNHHLIIISVKDDASRLLGKYRNKNTLANGKLNMNLK